MGLLHNRIWNCVPILLTWLAAGRAPAQDLTTADAVLARFVEVTGGRAAYEKLRSEQAKGNVEVVGMGLRGTIVARAAPPDKSYSSLDIAGIGTAEEGTYDGIAWENSTVQGPRVKSGEERAAALRESAFNSHIRWKELYAKAELAGIEDVEGKPCYKIVLTPSEGRPVTQFYDKESGLLVKVAAIVVSPMGDIPSETYLGDYKDVSGVLTPHSLKHKVMTQEIQIRIESVQYNADLPPNAFDPPAEVKALLDKQQPVPK
jgi:hypothetical protein